MQVKTGKKNPSDHFKRFRVVYALPKSVWSFFYSDLDQAYQQFITTQAL